MATIVTNNEPATNDVPAAKKVKLNYDLSKFRLETVLFNNSDRKMVGVVGIFTDLHDTDKAIVIFEKNAFKETDIVGNEKGYFSSLSKLNQLFINDIYGNFECLPNPEINNIKTTIIYPATQKHIEKYSIKSIVLVQETPDIYFRITLPHIEQEQFNVNWVYNILEHKQEADRIVYEDKNPETGFILVPDLKWDGKTIETLYLQAIVHKKDLKSLRDLTADHLPLLKNILKSGVEAIENKYDIKRSSLRIYAHYQPSYYHFHVHFNYIKYQAPGINCEKSHLLDSIISNIELLSDYYQRATLSFVTFENDKLYKKIATSRNEDQLKAISSDEQNKQNEN